MDFFCNLVNIMAFLAYPYFLREILFVHTLFRVVPGIFIITPPLEMVR